MNIFFLIFSLLKKIAKAEYYFSLPPKKDILIFDTHGADLIKSILPKNSYRKTKSYFGFSNYLFNWVQFLL